MGAALEYHVYVVTLGERIRERREALGLSQEKLSRAVDVSKNTVGRWESNVDAPSGKNAIRLATALQVTTDWILAGDEARTQPEPTLDVDEDMRLALAELLAEWDHDLQGPPPDEDERAWLAQLDFRSDRRAGLIVDKGLLFDRLKRRRLQARGKVPPAAKAEPPKVRPGRVKLAKTQRRRGG